MNTNVSIVNRTTNIEGTDTITYTLDNLPQSYRLQTERHGNDMYGNPLYRVRIENAPELTAVLPHVYRRYTSKGYALVQSYNIEYTAHNILTALQTFEFHGYIVIPHFQLSAFDTLSFEFSLMTQKGQYVQDEQEGQDYDTFRIFDDGTVKGTMSSDYYVYDEVELPGIIQEHAKDLYKQLKKFADQYKLDDQTQNAMNMFEEDEWEE